MISPCSCVISLDKTYYFLYRITNSLTGEFYLGVHSTDNILDGYMGSGKALQESKERYGERNFTREILEFFDTEEEMYAREAEVIDEKMLLNPLCLNRTLGGKCTCHMVPHKTSFPKFIPDCTGTTPVRMPDGTIKRVPKSEAGNYPSMHQGIPRSEETKRRISESKKGKPGKSLFWIHKDGKNTRVPLESLEQYISEGWTKGKTK